MTNVGLRRFYRKCFSKIGGNANYWVDWYRWRRPRRISRQAFFVQATWAVWVAGMGAATTRKFVRRAERNGFPQRFAVLAKWKPTRLRLFAEALHRRPTPPRAMQKWQAVHKIACELAAFGSEQEFRDSYFRGKIATKDLDQSDVDALTGRLPFIGSANAHFIVRNLGGEAIKCDRWIQAFLRCSRMTLRQLNARLRNLGVRAGLFDIVVWSYCEEFVKTTSRLRPHIRKLSAVS